MADDLLPKGPGGPVVLDTPGYDELARGSDRGNNLTTGPGVRVIETQTRRTVYIGSISHRKHRHCQNEREKLCR